MSLPPAYMSPEQTEATRGRRLREYGPSCRVARNGPRARPLQRGGGGRCLSIMHTGPASQRPAYRRTVGLDRKSQRRCEGTSQRYQYRGSCSRPASCAFRTDASRNLGKRRATVYTAHWPAPGFLLGAVAYGLRTASGAGKPPGRARFNDSQILRLEIEESISPTETRGVSSDHSKGRSSMGHSDRKWRIQNRTQGGFPALPHERCQHRFRMEPFSGCGVRPGTLPRWVVGAPGRRQGWTRDGRPMARDLTSTPKRMRSCHRGYRWQQSAAATARAHKAGSQPALSIVSPDGRLPFSSGRSPRQVDVWRVPAGGRGAHHAAKLTAHFPPLLGD